MRIASCLFAFVSVSLVSARAFAACPGPVAGWSNAELSTVDNSGGAALAHYYSLMTIDTAAMIAGGTLRADGGDLRVTDDQCNLYNFWVESGLNTASTKIWVDVPLAAATVQPVRIYHGNAAATRTNQASDVFGANIATLYTFTEGAGSVLHDRVGGVDLAIGAGPAWTTGFREGTSGIQNFTGGRVNAAVSGPAVGAGAFSTFVMVNPTAGDRSGTHGVIGNYNSDGTSGWTLKFQGSPGQMMLLTNQTGGWCQQAVGAVPADQWSLVGARRDPSTANAFFRNGVQEGATFCAGDTRNVNNSGPFEIGRSYNGNYALGGTISFASVYTRAVPDAEIAQLYGGLKPAVIPPLGTFVTAAAPLFTSANSTSFTVSVNGSFAVTASGAPAPTFSLMSGALPSGVSFDANGTLSGTPALGTVGSYPVMFEAANGWAPNAQQAFTLNVVKADQTITFDPISDQTWGTTPAALVATASSSLNVAFASTTPTVCTVSGTTLTFVSAGTCTIAANQAGDANYNAAPQVMNSFNIVAVPPSAPSNVVATAGNASVTFTFAAPADTGGEAVTGYTVTCIPASLADAGTPDAGDAGDAGEPADAGKIGNTVSGTASPLTVTGLTNGTLYTCTIEAITNAGNGAPLSLNATPVAPIPDAGPDSGPVSDSGLKDASFSDSGSIDSGTTGDDTVDGGGCDCSTTSSGPVGSSGAVLFIAGIAAWIARRKRA